MTFLLQYKGQKDIYQQYIKTKNKRYKIIEREVTNINRNYKQGQKLVYITPLITLNRQEILKLNETKQYV